MSILVVNAATGEFEAGFESGGQTREHAMLVRSFGVKQMAVAVNKMDTVSIITSPHESLSITHNTIHTKSYCTVLGLSVCLSVCLYLCLFLHYWRYAGNTSENSI